MSDTISKTQRWLDLIAYLVGRRLPVAVEEIMERVPAYAREWARDEETARASVRRKFERDKDELRKLGIPLETVSYEMGGQEHQEGYLIRRKDFYLPYLRLLAREHGGATSPTGVGIPAPRTGSATPKPAPPPPSPAASVEVPRDEAAAAIQGLRALGDLPAFPLASAARSALRKITFDLDPESLGGGKVLFAVPPETARAVEDTRLLTDALRRRKTVAFAYRGMYRGETTQRTVRPWGLLFQHAHWYLVGWDEDREAERVFRVDRMEGVEVNKGSPNTPDYDAPEGDPLEAHRKRQAWELGEGEEPLTARVRFLFPASLWAERNGYGTLIRDEGEEGSLRGFEVRQPHPFLRWVLSQAGEAIIEEPPELKEGLATMVREVAALYGGGDDA